VRVSASIVASTTLALLLLGQPVGSQTAVPVGDEIQVNSYTTGDQFLPSAGMNANGDLFVVWQSYGSDDNDSSYSSIQGRIFTSIGVPIGPGGQVNTFTTLDQELPSVAVAPGGSFVVVWHSYGSFEDDSSGFSVQGQRYLSNGDANGLQFQVNTYTTLNQLWPAVGMRADGAFVVVWESDGSDGNDSSETSVQGRIYSSNGGPIGPQAQVNTHTTGSQVRPEVGLNADGDFVVVWEGDGSSGSDSSGTSIHGRIYTSAGVPIGPEAQVNTYTTDDQGSPAVGVDDAGNFVVVWYSAGSTDSDSFGRSIQGRVYNSTGVPFGPEAQVNTYTTGNQSSPEVAVDADGDFVVVWHSDESGGNDSLNSSIQGRVFSSNASPAGGQFQVNSYTAGSQLFPAVALDDEGNFVVVWDSDDSGGSDPDLSIRGQRFVIALFADGFESGDIMVWSSSVP